jgi:putrescine transport system substrate-binding protein
MTFKMKLLAASFCMTLTGMPLVCAAAESSATLKVANWNDYIDPVLLERFTAETGIKVDYKTYDSDEEAMADAKSGQYDVLSPSMSLLGDMIKGGVIQPFNTRTMSGFTEVQPMLMARLRSRDRTATYAVPYMWGRIGLAVDVPKVEALLGRKVTPTWDLVFNPETLAKISSCGVMMMDSPMDIASIYAHYKGKMIDGMTARKAGDFVKEMAKLEPYYQVIDSALYLDEMPAGNTCVAVVWEGDGRTLQADNPNIKYLLPVEGTVLFMDNMAIGSATKQKEAAEKYVDFMTRKDNALTNVAYTGYNTPSETVLKEQIKEDPAKFVSLSEVPVFLAAPTDDEAAAVFANQWIELTTMKTEKYTTAKELSEKAEAGVSSEKSKSTNNKS